MFFQDLDLDERIITSLNDIEITNPTDIQKAFIPNLKIRLKKGKDTI